MYPDEAFAALADFKLTLGTAKTRARQELLRATLSSHGATLFFSIAAIAMRAFRNRQLVALKGIVVKPWEGWAMF